MEYQTIIHQLNSGILELTINRPEKLNALNRTVIQELGDAVAAAMNNEAVKGIIITGSGNKAFVAGADITELSELSREEGMQLAAKGQAHVFNRIEKSTKPIIAAVNGFALGGGFELALACHFRLAADNAKFGLPEVNLGLIPGYGGTQRLTQLVGKGIALEMMMTGSMVDAAYALSKGIVNHVTTPEELLPKTRAILSTILQKAPLAVGKVIALANLAATGNPQGYEAEIAAFGDLFATADMREGTAAFMAKRKPEFKGV
jgi:enoyl-CoA hydratase